MNWDGVQGLTNTEVDRLGERLRSGNVQESDLEQLEHYRASFAEVSAAVLDALTTLGLEPTARRGKTTLSIIAKLQRQPEMRLSRMQDVAGCRLIVTDAATQNTVVQKIVDALGQDRTKVVDRREAPTHGYRAVHVIARIQGRPFEIQVHTETQHLWAAMCERLADELRDPSIKYGGGNASVQEVMQLTSEQVAQVDDKELAAGQIQRWLDEVIAEIAHVQGLIPEDPLMQQTILRRLTDLYDVRDQHNHTLQNLQRHLGQSREDVEKILRKMQQIVVNFGPKPEVK